MWLKMPFFEAVEKNKETCCKQWGLLPGRPGLSSARCLVPREHPRPTYIQMYILFFFNFSVVSSSSSLFWKIRSPPHYRPQQSWQLLLATSAQMLLMMVVIVMVVDDGDDSGDDVVDGDAYIQKAKNFPDSAFQPKKICGTNA